MGTFNFPFRVAAPVIPKRLRRRKEKGKYGLGPRRSTRDSKEIEAEYDSNNRLALLESQHP